MSKLPGVYTQEYEDRLYLVNDQGLVRGQDVVLDYRSSSPITPAHRVLPGTVIVKQQGSERFVDAASDRGERNQPAAVSSQAPADAAWGGTVVTVSLAGGLGFAIPLAAAVNDNATAIDALNQSPAFANLFLADEDQAGLVRVRTRAAGAHAYLHVQSSLDAAFGAAGTAAHGLDADYRVTDSLGELRDLKGSRIHASVATLVAGHFHERHLLHLTPEARVVFARRGSVFRS
ncbi:MAG TPA: hypothetical protein DEA08_18675 [Planctomycetes bacterium]|nr:hypothetical protein [Planctomycetota bacterium]